MSNFSVAGMEKPGVKILPRVMTEFTERIKLKVWLFLILLLGIAAFYAICKQQRPKIKPSQELKVGLKVLTDPESLVKDP